mmetsp:Transcript_13196/g.36447  ORF Transcript_13196/g.36447 Transcript_13196/m.36447 type:complete len:85 (-) Transcript_13196:177-431(-)
MLELKSFELPTEGQRWTKQWQQITGTARSCCAIIRSVLRVPPKSVKRSPLQRDLMRPDLDEGDGTPPLSWRCHQIVLPGGLGSD